MNRIPSQGLVPIVRDDCFLASSVSSLNCLSLRAVTLLSVKQILQLAPFALPLHEEGGCISLLGLFFLEQWLLDCVANGQRCRALPRVGVMAAASTVADPLAPYLADSGLRSVLTPRRVCQRLLQTWCQNEDHKHLLCAPKLYREMQPAKLNVFSPAPSLFSWY